LANALLVAGNRAPAPIATAISYSPQTQSDALGQSPNFPRYPPTITLSNPAPTTQPAFAQSPFQNQPTYQAATQAVSPQSTIFENAHPIRPTGPSTYPASNAAVVGVYQQPTSQGNVLTAPQYQGNYTQTRQDAFPSNTPTYGNATYAVTAPATNNPSKQSNERAELKKAKQAIPPNELPPQAIDQKPTIGSENAGTPAVPNHE